MARYKEISRPGKRSQKDVVTMEDIWTGGLASLAIDKYGQKENVLGGGQMGFIV